ncbi:unnamed protein product [Rangifer tarandus platyrhynchus]|uniref:Uncharacterized protein n=1 Tax=Rangifer tarandus platyrhynchus TaxID=3082113 RepID=A0AC59ZVQ0_RANTA
MANACRPGADNAPGTRRSRAADTSRQLQERRQAPRPQMQSRPGLSFRPTEGHPPPQHSSGQHGTRQKTWGSLEKETYILIRWPLSPVLLLQGIELTQASGRLDSLPYPQHLLPSAALEDLQNSMVFASSSPSPPPGCPRTTDREGDGPRTGSSGHCPRRSAGGHLLGTRLKPHALPLTVRSTWNTGSDVHPAKGFSTCRTPDAPRPCPVSRRPSARPCLAPRRPSAGPYILLPTGFVHQSALLGEDSLRLPPGPPLRRSPADLGAGMTQCPEVTREGRAPSTGRRLIKAAREAARGGPGSANHGARGVKRPHNRFCPPGLQPRSRDPEGSDPYPASTRLGTQRLLM